MDIKTANIIDTIEHRINEYLVDSDFKIRKQKTEIFKETDDDKVRVCIWVEFKEDNLKMSERTKSSEIWDELKRLKQLINSDNTFSDDITPGVVSATNCYLQVVYKLE